MIEEPYRWVEAIANRREYIETQLASGASIAAVSCAEGIVLVTAGQQKLFEIYDRIALGAIGHPGDIERLRMAAIEVASTEGFTRSAADVSLRRLAHYSLSPVLKTAFEQVYGAPYLARLLFAEVGSTPADDLFLELDYDGAIRANGAGNGKARESFAVISGDPQSAATAETLLRSETDVTASLAIALKLACRAIASGSNGVPSGSGENNANRILQAVVLERNVRHPIRYRGLAEAEIQAARGD